MLASASPWIWYSTRATGTVALVLMTGAVVLGILTATRVATAGLPRFAVSELHRRVSLLSLVFLGLHVVTAALDSFVPIGWTAVFVPFTSGYRPFWVGLGAIAFDLMTVIVVTSLLRPHISAGAWRGVHWLVYLSWPMAVVHSIGTGTDVRFSWMDLLLTACVGSVVAALGWRVWADPRRGGFRTAVPRGRGPRNLSPPQAPAIRTPPVSQPGGLPGRSPR